MPDYNDALQPVQLKLFNDRQRATFYELEDYLDNKISQPGALDSLTNLLANLNQADRGTAIEELANAGWHYYKGTELNDSGEVEQATKHLKKSTELFLSLGEGKFAFFSDALAKYSEAMLELQHFNVQRAANLLKQIPDNIEDMGPVGRRYRQLADLLQPDIIYAAALVAMNSLNFTEAKQYVEQAANECQKLVKKYYAVGMPEYHHFLGVGHFYRGAFKVISAHFALDRLQLTKALEESRDSKELVSCIEHLEKAKPDENIYVDRTLKNAKSLKEVAHVVHGLAAILQNLFDHRIAEKPKAEIWTDFRMRTNVALDLASQIGPTATLNSRFVEGLLEKVNNVERLAQPNRQDFGIYSGVVSAIALVPLFLFIALINQVTNLQLPPVVLFIATILFSLIVGFGVGAAKFKDLFLDLFKS